MEIIYSREGERADEVIARLADALGAAAGVVSSDRAVQAAARAAGGVAFSCAEFERRMADAAAESGGMNMASGKDEAEEPTAGWGPRVKHGNPSRRSKADRRKAAKLKKL